MQGEKGNCSSIQKSHPKAWIIQVLTSRDTRWVACSLAAGQCCRTEMQKSYLQLHRIPEWKCAGVLKADLKLELRNWASSWKWAMEAEECCNTERLLHGCRPHPLTLRLSVATGQSCCRDILYDLICRCYRCLLFLRSKNFWQAFFSKALSGKLN